MGGLGKGGSGVKQSVALCVQRLGKVRGKQKADREAEVVGTGLFSMMEIKVNEREGGRG